MAAAEKFMWCLLLILQFRSCTCLDKITTNQTFKEGNLLVSEGNYFAFGFFSPGKSTNRYLGIWFHKDPGKSVVWVANRNYPIIGSSGALSISQHGNLVLHSDPHQMVLIWSTNVTGAGSDVSVLQLLDTGNLVLLQGTSKRIVWQSFDYPTNTLLAGMRIGFSRKAGLQWNLTSWRSENDPGTGDYTIELDTRGSPQFVVYKGSRLYWRGTPWPWRKFSDIYNYTLVTNEDETYYFYSMFDDSFFLRSMIWDSGLIKVLRLHKSEDQWKEMWSAPEYRCDLYGKCGASSKCAPSNPDKFECSCLPGYAPKYPRDWQLRDASGGCVRKREDPSLLCGHGEGFVKVENVKLPDTSIAVWVDLKTSHMGCEQECKKNCSCSAYASIDVAGKGSGCLAWYGQLWDTVDHVYEPYDLYVRVDAVELAENARTSTAFHRKELKILILSIASAWFTLFLFAYLWLRRSRKGMKNKSENRVLDPVSGSINYNNTLMAWGNNHPPDITSFGLGMIVAATNNFSPSNKLGQGGFGAVYKVELHICQQSWHDCRCMCFYVLDLGQLFNGQEVAVKRLSRNSVQGIEEFKNEVMLIAKLQHRNLVKLLGCCIEGGEQMLIYEYLPNKSLDSFLFDQTRRPELDWRKRFNIITGVARGILYLHQDSRLRVIHRDLKSSNILLDAEMNAKISDFGMARIFKTDQIQEKTNRVVGTYGYMSPEYAVFGKFSVKSDVFSFGVILLEIISGKKSNDFEQKEFFFCLIGHVWKLWREDKVLEIVDPTLEGSYPPHEVLRCIQIGLLCVQENAMDRPTMLEVALMLGSETTLPMPKQPAYVFRASSSNANSFEVGEERSSSVNEVTITTFVAR
ncbi:G-type lectin S-receptor-like serine/threonine-protein kinase RKS1 isoform X1 [Jatropha curcas]|uniref:G-type lectin S-receptor-like serine/threonine-protein kinase RKS1 isoform X1 n=2 Tax=Jatropha curcas TaxID=180498 RepID=UPI0009D66CFD|nr:G-type lectin S-receptor-like serine/threonine-protein kinase RKS1 isoform X1 [Jatropha curcas]